MKEIFSENQQPQNTRESQRSKEEKKGILEIKIDENIYMIEKESYDFEYPERIQKETGIIGYERTKISNENLFKIMKGEFGPFLEKYNINSFDEFLAKYKKLKESKNAEDSDDAYAFKSFFKGPIQNILENISSGEYPDNCFTHQMGAYSHTDKNEMGLKRDFKDDSFFLQKIYDIDRIEKNINDNKKPEEIFNYHTGASGNGLGGNYPHSNFNLYDKKTNQKLIQKEYIGNIVKYKEDLKSGKVFAATPGGGLNFNPRGFWNSELNFDSIGFGFPLKAGSFLNEYVEKALECYCEIEIKNNPNFIEDNPSWLSGGLDDAFALYATIKYGLNNDVDIKNLYSLPYQERREETHFINEKMEKIIDDFFEKHKLENIFKKNKNYKSDFSRGFSESGDEIKFPIFIGRDDIPQLSWGHAKYAHYFNEKGLNFFEFKHAEHLPEPEKLKNE